MMKVSFNGWYKIPNSYVVRHGTKKLGLTGIIPDRMFKKGVIATMHDANQNSFMCVRNDMEKIFEKYMKRLKVVPKKVNKPF